MFAFGLDPKMFQQQQDTIRCSGNERRLSLNHISNSNGMKSIHIFIRIDRIDHFLITDMFGQRQLNQYPVHIRIIIQLFNFIQQLVSEISSSSLISVDLKPVSSQAFTLAAT
jgi:hypothetical protein